KDAEPGDDTLASLVVAVQNVDGQPPGANRLDDLLASLVLLAVGDLPEADLPWRDVEVAAEHAERLERGALIGRPAEIRIDVAAVEDADAGADVAKRDRDVHVAVHDLDAGAAARHVDGDLVHEAGVQGPVVGR